MAVPSTLMFLIHINDMSKVSNFLHLIQFLDDIPVCACVKNLSDLVLQMNCDLTFVDEWWRRNWWSLRVDKKSHTIIPHNVIPPNVCLYIKKCSAKKIHASIFLGLIINHRLWLSYSKVIAIMYGCYVLTLIFCQHLLY